MISSTKKRPVSTNSSDAGLAHFYSHFDAERYTEPEP